MAFSIPAMAAGTDWALNVWGGSGGTPPGGPWGNVNVVDNGNSLTFTVTLTGPDFFVDTGVHNVFTFNLNVNVDSIDTSASFGTGLINGAYDNPNFGTFTDAIAFDSSGNNSHLPPLIFNVNRADGIDIANIVPNGNGATFAADVLFQASGLTGTIGNGVPAIPEPETYAMMLVGFGLLGFVARRRKQSLANVVPA